MRIGNAVYDYYSGSSIQKKRGYGLSIKNDSLKNVQTTEDEEILQKKKIVQNFEAVITDRLKNDVKNQKNEEEIIELVDSICRVIEKIEYDFGEVMATEAMAKLLTDTEQRINDTTIAGALGSILKAKQLIIKKIIKGTATEKDVELFTKEHHAIKKDEETYNPDDWKKDYAKINSMVDFLNGEDTEITEISGENEISLSTVLNDYYGEVIIKDEDYYKFSLKFDWLRTEDVTTKNREYFNEEYGFDFTMSVDEFGRENLDELIDFLKNDLNDKEAANFIENLHGSHDIFAAFNYLLETHYLAPNFAPINNTSNNIDEQDTEILANLSDYQRYIQEKFCISDEDMVEAAKYELPAEPPQYDYNSKYMWLNINADFVDEDSITEENFNSNLNYFLNSQFLDKVNAVIQENSSVRERFLKIAAKNFGGNEQLVPENYGLTAIPTNLNMASFSTSHIMGVMDTNAAERSLANLKILAEGTHTVELPWLIPDEFKEVISQARIVTKNYYTKMYNEAIERYQNEQGLLYSDLKNKGLLLNETI
jgi:hypothetical protein